MEIVLGESDTSTLVTEYTVSIQVEPEGRQQQEDENTVLTFNVNQITEDFRLVLHFNLALNQDYLFGTRPEGEGEGEEEGRRL